MFKKISQHFTDVLVAFITYVAIKKVEKRNNNTFLGRKIKQESKSKPGGFVGGTTTTLELEFS